MIDIEWIKNKYSTIAKRTGIQPKSSLSFEYFDVNSRNMSQYWSETSEKFAESKIKTAVTKYNSSTTRNSSRPKEHLNKFTKDSISKFDFPFKTTHQVVYQKPCKHSILYMTNFDKYLDDQRHGKNISSNENNGLHSF